MDEDHFKCNHSKRQVTIFQSKDGNNFTVKRKNCFDHRLSEKCVSYLAVRKDTFETLSLTEWYTTFEKDKFDNIQVVLNRAFKKISEIEHANLGKYIGYEVSFSNKNIITISILQEFIQGSTLAAIFLKNSIPCGILFLQHIAVGCLQAMKYLHDNDITCNGLDPSQVYIDYRGEIRIATFNLMSIIDNMVSENYNSDSNTCSKATDILCFGNLLKILVNGNLGAKEMPATVTGNLLSFMNICLQTDKVININELLEHPFLNKDHDDYNWAPNDDIAELSPLTDISSPSCTQFIKQIGKGNFGRVLLIRNPTDRKQYALKLISLHDDEEKNKEIRKEVVVLSGLEHPNVVRYFTSGIIGEANTESGRSNIALLKDISSTYNPITSISSGEISIVFENEENDDEDTYSGPKYTPSILSGSIIWTDLVPTGRALFILMEYCDKTLKEAIDEDLYSDRERIWRLFREMLKGLRYIHSEKLLHRDLKPVNIFLDSNDQIKIGDFGLATKRVRKDSLNEPALPAYESMTGGVGTSVYVAPELLIQKDKVEYDNKIDMYSLGIIFFEMCYRFRTELERSKTLTKLREVTVILPSDGFCTYLDAESQEMREIIKLLLNHDPSKRPSCEDLLQREKLSDDTELERQKVIDRIFSKPKSSDYSYLLKTCFKQTPSSQVKTMWNDLRQKSKEKEYMLIMDFISNKLRDIFKLHGYHNFSSPLFLLEYKCWTTCSNVQLMTSNGSIVSIPFDLRLPFAQHIGKTYITSLRRYTIERVFRKEETRMPLEYQECAYDLVSLTPDPLCDIEILGILCQIVKEIPPMTWGKLRLRVNHTGLVEAILQRFGIKIPYLNCKSILFLRVKNPDAYNALQKEYSLDSLKDLMNLLVEPARMEKQNIFRDLNEILKSLQYYNKASFAVVISPNLLKNISQYSGMMYQLQLLRKNKEEKPILLAEGGRYDHLITDNSKKDVVDRHVVGLTLFLDAIIKVSLQPKTNLEWNQYNEMLKNLNVIICSAETKTSRITSLDNKLKLLLQLFDERISCRLINILEHDKVENKCKELNADFALTISNNIIPIKYFASVHARHPKQISESIIIMQSQSYGYSRKMDILLIIINVIFNLICSHISCEKHNHFEVLFPLTKQDWVIIYPILIRNYKFGRHINSIKSNKLCNSIILHSPFDSTTFTLEEVINLPDYHSSENTM